MEVDIRSERNLGLIGSILAIVSGFFGVVPYIGMFGSVLPLVAFILILLALKGIGDKVGDDRPFKYYLYGIIASFACIILAVILVIMALVPMSFSTHVYSRQMNCEITNIKATGFAIFTFVLFIIMLILSLILTAYFQKRAWDAMYEITGVNEFHETAKWLWWGALTLIVLVGVILLLIAMIYQIIAFSNLPEILKVGGESLNPSTA